MPEYTERPTGKDKALGVGGERHPPREQRQGQQPKVYGANAEKAATRDDQLAGVRKELFGEKAQEQNEFTLEQIRQLEVSSYRRPGEAYILHPEISPLEWMAKMEAQAREAVPETEMKLSRWQALKLSWSEVLKAIVSTLRGAGASEEETEKETHKQAA